MTLGVSISVCNTKIKKCVLPIFQTLLALISGLNSSPVKSWIFSKFMGVNWDSTSVPLRTCFIRIATKLVMLLCQPRTQSNFNSFFTFLLQQKDVLGTRLVVVSDYNKSTLLTIYCIINIVLLATRVLGRKSTHIFSILKPYDISEFSFAQNETKFF